MRLVNSSNLSLTSKLSNFIQHRQRVATLLPNSFSTPTLIAQLQARYPTASLIAELVTVHQENFVVRALVQVGGTTLATGMAAAADVEQAEDRAKIRVLAALGISGFASQPQSLPYPSPSLPANPATEFTPSSPPAPSILEPSDPLSSQLPVPATELPLPEPLGTSTVSEPLDLTPVTSFVPSLQPQIEDDHSEYDFDYQFQSYGTESYEPEGYESESNPPINDTPVAEPLTGTEPEPELDALPPDSTATPLPAHSYADPPEPTKPASPSGRGKSAKRKSESAAAAPSSSGDSRDSGDNDRSEEIAKIGLEMKRLGWTTEQGRNYLKRTYGKRSRQELDDSELVDFLRYLETQISSSESPF